MSDEQSTMAKKLFFVGYNTCYSVPNTIQQKHCEDNTLKNESET